MNLDEITMSAFHAVMDALEFIVREIAPYVVVGAIGWGVLYTLAVVR